MVRRIIKVLICLTATVQMSTQSDMFASVIDIENFVQTQGYVIDSIENYIDMEIEKIETLKRLLVPYKQSQEKALEDIPYYVQNPFNAFKLIKRLSLDLQYIESIMNTPSEYERSQEVMYPDKEELQGAGEGLIRMQVAYKLNVTEISRGVLKTNYSHDHNHYEEKFAPMSSSDCFEVGKAAYYNKNSKDALPWILEAFKIYTQEGDAEDDLGVTSVIQIVELIAMSYLEIGDIENAITWTKELSALEPMYPDYKVTRGIYEYVNVLAKNTNKNKYKKLKSEETEKKQIYYMLCRGDIEVPADIAKRLSCRYLTNNHPFLKIAPLKAEQLCIDPPVMLAYNMLNDEEIEIIKKQALDKKLKREGVRYSGKNYIVKDRISKTTWLDDYESETIARLSRRLHHYTRMTTDSAEEFHVTNYGIGGVFEFHHDIMLNEDVISNKGQRVATILTYLSDVTQGGATVFVELNLTVFPVKGASLFWINLHDTGAADMRLVHGACPVLRGSKWAANKLLREHGQEWVRPCPVKPKYKIFLS